MNLAVLVAGSVGFGLALGLFGSGGSLLALPAFVYGLGWDIKQAVVGSLVAVGVTALAGLAWAVRKREVCFRNALSFLAASLPASFGGAVLGRSIDSLWQTLLFAALAFVAALRLLLWRPVEREETCNPKALPLFVSGAGIGFLTGLLGVGGGFLIVPALVLLGGIGMKRARATSLFLIAANTGSSLLGYAGKVAVSWDVVAAVIGLAIPASFAGAALARRLPSDRLQKGFAWALLVLGAVIAIEALAGARFAP